MLILKKDTDRSILEIPITQNYEFTKNKYIIVEIINISHYYVEKDVITMFASLARQCYVLLFVGQKSLINLCMLGII